MTIFVLYLMIWGLLKCLMERSDRICSTGERNGKSLQYSCLENPMNSMKRQNDSILKEELPRSVGAQYATGNQWRNNSRKNEGISVVSVVLEKTLESPLDCKEIQPVHSEGDQPWDCFGRNDAKAETPVLWPPHAKS